MVNVLFFLFGVFLPALMGTGWMLLRLSREVQPDVLLMLVMHHRVGGRHRDVQISFHVASLLHVLVVRFDRGVLRAGFKLHFDDVVLTGATRRSIRFRCPGWL